MPAAGPSTPLPPRQLLGGDTLSWGSHGATAAANPGRDALLGSEPVQASVHSMRMGSGCLKAAAAAEGTTLQAQQVPAAMESGWWEAGASRAPAGASRVVVPTPPSAADTDVEVRQRGVGGALIMQQGLVHQLELAPLVRLRPPHAT